MSKDNYDASKISVLRGLDPVKQRPGMYTRTENPNHMIYEVIDNAQDEALGGFASEFSVEIKDDYYVISDNGRGIPVDLFPDPELPKEKWIPAVQVIFTKLHSGGKFNKGEEDSSYRFSGGLHGVGVCVTNALAHHLIVEVFKGGQHYKLEFQEGELSSPLQKMGKCGDKHGTRVSVKPNLKYFENKVDVEGLKNYLKSKSPLLNNVKISFKNNEDDAIEWHYSDLQNYLMVEGDKNQQNLWVDDSVFFNVKKYLENDTVYGRKGEGFELSLGFFEEGRRFAQSYVNLINTGLGGGHEAGLKSGLFEAMKSFMTHYDLVPQKLNIESDDLWQKTSFVLSVKMVDPQFQNQTKDRLTSKEAPKLVSNLVKDSFELWLNEHIDYAKRLAAVVVNSAYARSKAEVKVDRKRGNNNVVLPGKLSDCADKNPENTELYLVEGDSAAGCFSGDTKVALADGRNLSFLDLIEEDKKGIVNYCYTILKDGNVGIEKILHPRMTKEKEKVLKLTLDNGEEIVCTFDDLFMDKEGNYIKAKELNNSISLMPLYKKLSKKEKRITIEGYEMIWNNKTNKWIFTHMLSDDYNLLNNIYEKSDGIQRHHKDFNKLNNNPNNIVRLSSETHFKIHSNHIFEYIHNNPKVQAKLKEIRQTETFKNKIKNFMNSDRAKKIHKERNEKLWSNQDYKEYMKNCSKNFYKKNPHLREMHTKNLIEKGKLFWKNLENRNIQSNRIKLFYDVNPQQKEYLSIIAKKQWDDKELLNWRKEKTKEQWTEDFRKQRKISYDETYLQSSLRFYSNLLKNEKIDFDNLYEYKKQNFKQIRNVLKVDNLLVKFFNNDKNLLKEALLNFNHRIVNIELLEEEIPVYDIEVENTHNFALASGVFVHNSSKQGRDKNTQAILPMRGKVLNTWEVDSSKLFGSSTVEDIAMAIGIPPHTMEDKVDFSKLRYFKIIAMCDADVDGKHIQVLLLTLFLKHFPQLVARGHVYIAQAPLFRVDAPSSKKAKNKLDRKIYASNEAELDKIKKQLKKEGYDPENCKVSRFKGLGEMNPQQLWETTMDPSVRTLLQVTMDTDHMNSDIETFSLLMGGKNANKRKEWMEENGNKAEDIDV